jgi:predicted nucleic acid-binding Zn ribbon protein
MAEAPLVDCPECEGYVHRVIQPVGIVFRGSGFYVTDNRSHSSTALPGQKDNGVKKESDSSTGSSSDGGEKTKSD